MIYGHKAQGNYQLPSWVTSDLFLWYWQLRVEKPVGAKRRKLYRYIAKEKLRLAELGIDQRLIDATCKYLCSYSVISGERMSAMLHVSGRQLCSQNN
jgi:hypothetical protein